MRLSLLRFTVFALVTAAVVGVRTPSATTHQKGTLSSTTTSVATVTAPNANTSTATTPPVIAANANTPTTTSSLLPKANHSTTNTEASGGARATFAPKSAAQQEQGYAIRIDVNKPVLRLYQNGNLKQSYPVALGTTKTRTPIGSWVIVDKQSGWGGGFGSRWLGLNVPWGTYGIHGTNRPDSIGKYVSNGCIRMHNRHVEELYNLVPVGTPVEITGNPLKPLRTLRHGDIGADVQLVQKALQDAGFYHGPLHGKFDDATQMAVGYLELARGLFIDGVVGQDDYRSLRLS